jgi:hypothetical protein
VALVLKEGALSTRADLVLGRLRLPVRCEIMVEWIRGVSEPTWYGYFSTGDPDSDPLPLPGSYQIELPGEAITVLLRRPTSADGGPRFPFWGIGPPPTLAVESAA